MDKKFDFSTAKKLHEVAALQQLQQAYQRSIQVTQVSNRQFDNMTNNHCLDQLKLAK